MRTGSFLCLNSNNVNEPFCIFDGQLYNRKDLRKTLEENGFSFDSSSDTELLKNCYIYYGKDLVNHLNGVFAFVIWDNKKQELFMARDHFGVKPLFYTMQNNSFIFASEIKTLFKYPGVQKILNAQGISELFGIGPAHTLGTTVFDNIFELKPAHFAVYNRSGLHLEKYWSLKSEPHTENLTQTCDHLEFLLKNSITTKKISLSYHDSATSFLEGAFARGDRRMSAVIEKAYEMGCKFDGWTECFEPEKWYEAFKECGLSPEFYANRTREYDEVTPWEHIDVGVTKDFLVKENKVAHENKTTPNCREKCSACGANCYGEGVCFEKR